MIFGRPESLPTSPRFGKFRLKRLHKRGLAEQHKSRPRFQDIAINMQRPEEPRFDDAFAFGDGCAHRTPFLGSTRQGCS